MSQVAVNSGPKGFGEPDVIDEGRHTDQSRERLEVVWGAMLRMFQEFEKRGENAEASLRALLVATKSGSACVRRRRRANDSPRRCSDFLPVGGSVPRQQRDP